jgi:hypothetical protein
VQGPEFKSQKKEFKTSLGYTVKLCLKKKKKKKKKKDRVKTHHHIGAWAGLHNTYTLSEANPQS